MLLLALVNGVRILVGWDMGSGSERQLALERRTYLVSTILSYVMSFQLISLFLFIFTADRLHSLFSGAMCAAGTLNANGFGYPLLILKVVNFLLAGVWLILNHADTRGFDYPLIRVKYVLLVAIVPLVFLETFFFCSYFLGLHADIITSCCGSLFSPEKEGVASELASLPSGPTEAAFFSVMATTFIAGLYFCRKGKGGYVFSALSFASFLIACASLISFICLYYYELPTHHCPFCILQKEYGFIGYILYITLLGGAVTGLGTGALQFARRKKSLRLVVPTLQKRLATATIVLYLAFTLLVSCRMIFANLTLRG